MADASPARAFGLGAAVSAGPVKIGIGGLLVRHTALDGDTVAQRLPNAQFIKTRDTYGRPRFYASISIFHLGELLGLGHNEGSPGSGGGSSAPAAAGADAATRPKPPKG